MTSSMSIHGLDPRSSTSRHWSQPNRKPEHKPTLASQGKVGAMPQREFDRDTAACLAARHASRVGELCDLLRSRGIS